MLLGYLNLKRHYGLWRTEINPANVVYLRVQAEWPFYVNFWPILACPGNWDLSNNTYPPFGLKQMKELFQDHVPYQQTKSYQGKIKELEQKGVTHAPKLHSREEIDVYFSRLTDLYHSMRNNGFKTRDRQQLGREGEITIRIGRDGTLIKCGEGTHRLALALFLEIGRVPVVVDMVHTSWVKSCMKRFGVKPQRAVHMGLESLKPDRE